VLRELEGTLTSLMEGMPDAWLVVDHEGTIVFANRKADSIMQCPRGSLITTSVNALIAERCRDSYARLQTNFFLSASIQQSSDGEMVYALRRDGSELPVEIFLSPLPLRSGLVAALSIRDLTESIQVERELDHVLEAMRDQPSHLFFDAIPLPMWVSDRETLAFLAVNEPAIRHYGFSRSEFLMMTTRDLCLRLDEEFPQTETEEPERLKGIPGHTVQQHRKKDGSVIEVEVTSSNIHFGGRAARLVVVHDVTQQTRDQKELRQSKERFAKAFQLSPAAITISTLTEGRYIDVNDAFLNIMGYSREAVIGRTVRELGVWVDSGDRAAMVEDLAAVGSSIISRTKFRTKSGEIRLTNIFAERVEFDGIPCVLAITQDISEAHRLEEQLRQSQKMQAIGRLASGVAHDFSNMLSVILGYSELLAERDQTGSSAKSVEEIRKAAERAASLTRKLLAFSRQQVLHPKAMKVNHAAESATKMLVPLLGEDIEFLVKLDPAAGMVRADAVQIEQVLLNLAINARDAMPRGGRLMIETGNIDLDAPFAELAGLHPGPHVFLSISDTGCGMDAEMLAHIFEPFFTTKAPGKGTGLGLASVYGCVKQNGGHVWVTSQPGKGTCFKVYLPRIDEEAPPDGEPTTATAQGGSETVLVVEDDESLRMLTARVLEANGYVTLQAGDGKQAIEVATRYSGPIDLLVTDVVMPGLDGGELAAVLSAFRPELKLLYVSGYPNQLITYHGALETAVALLEKPFTTQDLLSRVRSVLSNPA
jgi:two-component system, cell cycle sensor histidine kinase and response regulator CckA